MKKLKKKNYNDILDLLSEYDHSIPIIYSMIEEQFDCEIFVDDTKEISYGILFTPFEFHYLFGDSSKINKRQLINTIKEYIVINEKEEFFLFNPNDSFDDTLAYISECLNGVIDYRVSLSFNETTFKQLCSHVSTDEVVITKEIPEFGKVENLKASIKVNDKVVSYSNALMVGKNEAEIDIFTNDEFRGKGYAFTCSVALIRELLNSKLKPNWTAWKAKKASVHIAEKLGFENIVDLKTCVWIKRFGTVSIDNDDTKEILT